MTRTPLKGYALAVIGSIWLGVVVFVVQSRVILRETPLGIIARGLDELPSPLREALFLACWAAFFLGWTVPVFCAARAALLTEKRSGPSRIKRAPK